MGLGERGKHRIEGNALKVNELFKPTEDAGTAASGESSVEKAEIRPVDRFRSIVGCVSCCILMIYLQISCKSYYSLYVKYI